MGRATWRSRDLASAGCVSDGDGIGRNAWALGVPIPGIEYGIAASAILLGAAVMFEASSAVRPRCRAGWIFRNLPWPCARHRTAAKPKRAALQHGLRHCDWLSACGGNRHRDRLSMAVGTEASARCGRRYHHWRAFLYVAGLRMKFRTRVALSVGAVTAVLVAVCPPSAQAHLIATGMGPVYDGMAHFLLSPDDLIPVLALALMVGLGGARYGRRALFVLPTAWLIGRSCRTVSTCNKWQRRRVCIMVSSTGWISCCGYRVAISDCHVASPTTGSEQGVRERSRIGSAANCHRRPDGPDLRSICGNCPCERIRADAARAVGANCCPRGRELGCCYWCFDARLGIPVNITHATEWICRFCLQITLPWALGHDHCVDYWRGAILYGQSTDHLRQSRLQMLEDVFPVGSLSCLLDR